MRLRVCYVSHASKLEGAGRSLIETVQLLAARGVAPHVLLPRPGPMVERLAELGIPHTVWPYAWWLGKGGEGLPRRLLRYGLAFVTVLTALPLAWRLRSQGFDLVYSNTVASPFGAVLARLLGRPHLWHLREFVEQDHGMTYLFGRRRTLRWVERSADACITNSRAVAEAFSPPLPAEKVATVYQAVSVPVQAVARAAAEDAGAVDAPDPAELRCLLLGRMHPGKGQAVAIEAMRLLRDRGLALHLTLVGDGEPAYVAELRQRVAAAGLGDRVTLHGFTLDPWSHLAACDLMLMCSRNEAFGRVTVEAMKMGKPVVGARSGGTTELVREGETGWLFTPDDPLDLAEKLALAHGQRRRLPAMGRAAAAWADATFTEVGYAEGVLAQLRRALARPS